MFCCHSAGTAESQYIVEGAVGSNAAGENLMRLAGITDHLKGRHVTGGNEPWPTVVGGAEREQSGVSGFGEFG